MAPDSLYRTPLNLIEGDQSVHGHSWDLGYHHAKRGKPPEPNNPHVGDAEAYMNGYKTSKGEQSPEQAPARPEGAQGRPPALQALDIWGDDDDDDWGAGLVEPEYNRELDRYRPQAARPVGPPTEFENQIIDGIRSGQGIKPGDFRKLVGTSGQDPVALSGRMAPHFEAAGRRLVNGFEKTQAGDSYRDDPEALELKRAWERVENWGLPNSHDAQVAAQRLIRRLSTLGKDAIPPEEYQQRHDEFVKAVVFKLKAGRSSGPNAGREASKYRNVSTRDIAKAQRYSSQVFDILGPIAEEALGRIGNMFAMPRGSKRSFYAPDLTSFCFDNRSSFVHEFAHGAEDHLNSPNTKNSYGHSYWSARVEGRDSRPAEWLGHILRRHRFKPEEVAKKDNWSHAYMGKVYTSGNLGYLSNGASEVVSMFVQAIGTGDANDYWSKQIEMDPALALEVAGFLHASMIGAQGMSRSDPDTAPGWAPRGSSSLPGGSTIRKFSQVFHPLYGKGEVTAAREGGDSVRVRFGDDEIDLTRNELKHLS